MSDDKTEPGPRETPSAPYEARSFAEKHGISIEQAELLIEAHGDDPEALDLAAQSIGGP